MLKKLFLIILIFLSALAVRQDVLASDYQFTTTVTRKAGVVEKFLERINFAMKFDNESKAKYWQKLVDLRLAELKMEVDMNNIDLIEETSSRYSTYLGNYSEFIINKKVINQRDSVLKQFDVHATVLAELRDKFKYDSAWWLMIQHDLNTITMFKDKVEKEL